MSTAAAMRDDGISDALVPLTRDKGQNHFRLCVPRFKDNSLSMDVMMKELIEYCQHRSIFGERGREREREKERARELPAAWPLSTS